MEKLHTPEPWKTVNGRNGNDCNVYGNEQENPPGTHSANGHSHSTFIAECEIAANARRIIACVNACRDMDMTVLEMPDYSVKSELDTLDAQIAGRLKAESQRDSLLSALRALYGWQRAEVEHFGATTPDDFIIEMVEKALKNTEVK